MKGRTRYFIYVYCFNSSINLHVTTSIVANHDFKLKFGNYECIFNISTIIKYPHNREHGLSQQKSFILDNKAGGGYTCPFLALYCPDTLFHKFC
jgi:hypothetical protein